MTTRRGVSLIELLIAMLVAAIIGASLISLLVGQSKFSERLTAERDARGAARSAQAIMAADLRMVDPDWGVESATTTLLRVRVPYALGIFCGVNGSNYLVQVLPVDPAQFDEAGHAGYAFRGAGGVYTPYTVAGRTVVGSTSACTGASPAITVVPNAIIVQLPQPATPPAVPFPGTPVMLYRRIEYTYGTSTVHGQRALFRTILAGDGNATVEIGGPFLATATFGFFARATPETMSGTAPVPITNLVGIQVGMPGRPERNPRLANQTVSTDLTTSIYFTNRRN
jgi:prepilin-type N-terminal cleavage/methylation domain-containing protein